MKKIIGASKVWLTEYSLLSPEDMQSAKAIEALTFCTADMRASGWTYVGEAIISVDMVLSPSELIASKIETLKSQQAKVRVEAQEKCNRLEDKIQNLLAITFESKEKTE